MDSCFDGSMDKVPDVGLNLGRIRSSLCCDAGAAVLRGSREVIYSPRVILNQVCYVHFI